MKTYIFLSVTVSILLLFGIGFFSSSTDTNILGAQSPFTGLSPQTFNNELRTGNYILLDIRTMEEYNSGHISHAKHIDFYQTQSFSTYLDALDKNAQYLIYCRSGNRTKSALSLMKDKGFTSAWDLSGEHNAWTALGLPIEK